MFLGLAWDWDDAFGDRAGDPGLPGRAPGLARDGPRAGRPPRCPPTTQSNLQAELIKLGRHHPLLVIDEVGCIPFEPLAANLLGSAA